MGTLSRMATRCRKCPDRHICQGKRMELCHIAEPAKTPATPTTGPVFNTQVTIDPAATVNSGLIDEALLKMSVRVLEEKEKERRRGVFCTW